MREANIGKKKYSFSVNTITWIIDTNQFGSQDSFPVFDTKAVQQSSFFSLDLGT